MAQSRFFLEKVSNGAVTELTGELIAGHLPECALQLTKSEAGGGPSRRHAKLSVSEDAAWVEDLNSTNGTFVNDERISARTRLRSGDRVRFDVEEFKFRAEGGAADNRTVARAAPKNRPESWVVDPPDKGHTVFVSNSDYEPSALPEPNAQVSTPMLIVCSGMRAGERIPLIAGPDKKAEWKIGSDANRDIVFTDKGVSRLHARLATADQRWKIVDEVSSNGTKVNGKPANTSYLRAGDRLQFGSVECEFQLPTLAGIAVRVPKSVARIAVIAIISFVLTICAVILFWFYVLKK